MSFNQNVAILKIEYFVIQTVLLLYTQVYDSMNFIGALC